MFDSKYTIKKADLKIGNTVLMRYDPRTCIIAVVMCNFN